MRKNITKQKKVVAVSPQAPEINKTQADIKHLTEELANKRKLLQEASDEFIAVSNKLATTEKKYSDLNYKLQKSQADFDSLEVMKEETNIYIANLRKRKELIDKELAQYKKKSLEEFNIYKNELLDEQAKLLKDKRDIENDIAKLQLNIEHLSKVLSDNQKAAEDEGDIFDGLVATNAELEININKLSKEKEKLNKDILVLKDEVTEKVN
jgi:chromosome segregation ATPase